MIARKRFCFAVLLFFVITFADVAKVYAIDIVPFPVRIALWDGMVFYMTPPGFEADGYPPSGLYRDGELVYTFNEWWPSPSHFRFANDGMSFMHGLSFYRQGVRIHSYDRRDFIIDGERIWAEWRASDFPAIPGPSYWLPDVQHDRVNDTVTMTTVEGSVFTFCLTTGHIVDYQWARVRMPAAQMRVIFVIVAVPMVIAGLVLVARRLPSIAE